MFKVIFILLIPLSLFSRNIEKLPSHTKNPLSNKVKKINPLKNSIFNKKYNKQLQKTTKEKNKYGKHTKNNSLLDRKSLMLDFQKSMKVKKSTKKTTKKKKAGYKK